MELYLLWEAEQRLTLSNEDGSSRKCCDAEKWLSASVSVNQRAILQTIKAAAVACILISMFTS